MIKRICLLVLLLSTMAELLHCQNRDFVKVEGLQFTLGDVPYYFLGTNLWYGMNLAMDGKDGDRDRLIRELDRLQALGVNNLRIMGTTEGPDTEPWRIKPSQQRAPGEYNEQVLGGLDFLLSEMKKREMYAVVCLTNFWAWSGGMSQYISWANDEAIPYHPPQEGGSWMRYQRFTSSFYRNKKAQEIFENHLRFLVNRVNTVSGVAYKDDPTIMSWQLANEPRSFMNGRTFRKWIEKTAALIKQLDPNHLVSLGGEGNADNYFAGASFRKDQKSRHIDYLTMHIWAQNWSWYDPHNADDSFNEAVSKAKEYIIEHVSMAKVMGKPVVLEEFGIARDLEAYEPNTPVKYRDNYYSRIFQEMYRLASIGEGVGGCNFWAWAGEGRPNIPGGFWKLGDDLIGDPPHESQGWYSVYDTDESTLSVIRRFASMFNQLGKTGNNPE
ncbi:MAG: cellulase family glycosylhydrolase [Roseivirga sp.]|nr:cellulase family glycosylhydrolase [Roseivirga sp.]